MFRRSSDSEDFRDYRKENKNRLKFDILFLFGTSNQFYLFQLVNIKIK